MKATNLRNRLLLKKLPEEFPNSYALKIDNVDFTIEHNDDSH